MQIVLASSSSRRKELLLCLLADFRIIPAEIDEERFMKLARTPKELVINLAKMKARKAVKIGGGDKKDMVVIAADTVVVLEKGKKWEIISKPLGKKNAREILRELRGEIHKVLTGLCVLQNRTGQVMIDCVASKVRFKNFSDKVMEDYITTGKPFNKAGAYGIQEIEEEFVKNFDGSFTNVMGLPVERLVEMLEDVGIVLRKDWEKRIKKMIGHEI